MNTYLLIGIIYGIIGFLISFGCIVKDITEAKCKKCTFTSGDLMSALWIIPFWIIWIFMVWGDSGYTILNFRDKDKK